MKYCSACGHLVKLAIPPGEDRERHVCTACDTIHYENPKIITGCLPIWEDQILLCKRAIEPRKGYWTLPAGFLENGESVEEGALRETKEEANADVTITRLLSVSSIPRISQVYMIYLATLNHLDFFPGEESLEVKLFPPETIPWADIAFSAVKYVLQCYLETPLASNVFRNTITIK